jgi:hypothetical protein
MEMLPLLRFGRVLIPGTRHSVRTSRADLGVGERVVVVLEQPDGSLGRVGTASRIHGIGRESDDRVVLELVGETLVSVDPDGDEASVGVIDAEERPGSPELVDTVERALRRYMAAKAEAGIGGDVLVTIHRDPVPASHQVASHLEITWPEVQDILEAGDAVERIRREITVLERETALLRAVLGRSD